jgi:hypothetical protein
MLTGKISVKERYTWIAVTAVLIIVAATLAVMYVRLGTTVHETYGDAERIQNDLVVLSEEIGRYDASLDTLRNRFEEKTAAAVSEVTDEQARIIANDLVAHPELIPYDGVLGGTMGFYSRDSVRVLSDRWVLASFEDGHRMGRMLLRYDVTDNGIVWKVIDSYLE